MALPTNTSEPNDPRQVQQPQPGNEQRAPRPPAPAGPGGLPMPPAPPRRMPTVPLPIPPEEEDVFEQIPVQEIEEEEDYTQYLDPEPEPAPRVERRPAPGPSPAPAPTHQPQRFDEYEVAPDPRSGESLEAEESNFVDPKNKKIKPFGGAKSKKRDKNANDSAARRYDSREDRRTKARVVQAGVIAALVGMVGFGGYNALNPPVGASPEEVNAAIEAARLADNFPQDRGAAFAEDFITTYLTYSAENANSQELLTYYYSGVIGGAAAESTATFNNVSQTLVSSPKSYKYVPLTSSTAAFEIGALVQTFSPATPVDPQLQVTAQDKYKWVFYNVNVYYDETTDTMAVTPDSPSLIPNASFGAAADIPDEKLLGTGEPSPGLAAAVRDSLYGYLEAYAVSTPTSHDLLNQYLIDGGDSGPELIKGLGGRFELAGGAETAVTYKAYIVEGKPNTTKLDVKVQWRDLSVPEETGALIYTSRYYIQMVKQANGQWLVDASAPKYYFEAPPTS